MSDTRAKAIENALEKAIRKNRKIDEKYIMEKLLNIIQDPFCSLVLEEIFSTLNSKEFYEKFKGKLLEKEENIFHKFNKLNTNDNKENNDNNNLNNFKCIMKSESKEALIYNVFEKHLVENLNYNIIKSELNINNNIKNNNNEEKIQILQNSKNNIMYYMSRENFLLHKIKSYRENKQLCERDYNKNCFDFYEEIITKTFKYIENNLSKNQKYWKWGNLTQKEFSHKPFSMINYLNIFAHRVLETEGNSRTPRVNYHRITMDFESVVSSNIKFLVTTNNDKMNLFISIDMGQSGKLFHKFYDDMMISHEKGILNYIDSYNLNKREFSLFFYNK